MRYPIALAHFGTLAAFLAAPAPSQERAPGDLSVLERGYWSCAVPGSAAGDARNRRPARDFETIRASRYRVGEEIGIYLRLGDMVEMTSGPFKGRIFRVTGTDSLREIEGGEETPMRCLRRPF